MQYYFEIDALQKLLYRGRFRRVTFPPLLHTAFGFLLFLVQHVHVNELKRSHFVTEEPHPRAHGRLTDDVDQISSLEEQTHATDAEQRKPTVSLFLRDQAADLEFEGVGVIRARGEVCVNQSSATERSSVRQLVFISVLWFHTLAVTGGRVCGADRLTACKTTPALHTSTDTDHQRLEMVYEYDTHLVP